MPDTDDWVVMHSVALAEHPTQSQGEADFVIVIPNKGIVVLEVKGGGISYSDGTWFSCDRFNNLYEIKNPQQEANEAMHAIRDYVAKKQSFGDRLQYALYEYGLVFPDTEIAEEFNIPDLAKPQIADITDCADIKRFLLRLADYGGRKKTPGIFYPNRQQCSEIVQLLRPDFVSHVSVGTIIRNLDNQIIDLTQNQQDIFDGLLENERNLVKGSAGTGKTILAVNYARTMAESKKRVGFFCYNLRLARYIEQSLSEIDGIVSGSLTEYAEKVARTFYPDRLDPQEDKNTYYASTLPELLAEAYLEDKIEPFDVLILDEAQDLMTPQYLEAMDCLLKDGLQNGNWCFFMDAEKQNLYHSAVTESQVREMLKSRRIFFATYNLKDNCRNTISIIEMMDKWFGTNTRSHLSDEYGYDVEIKSYKRQSVEAEALSKLISRLIKDGVKHSQIVVLSPVRRDASCVRLVEDYNIIDKEDMGKEDIRFCTIHGFKGLESPVVIITDIENVFRADQLNLLYVGITRARVGLYIFASEHAYKLLMSGGVLGNGK
jgi:hypothetical protein